jgi:hypothetical protein
VHRRSVNHIFGYPHWFNLSSIAGHFGRRCADNCGWRVPSYEDSKTPDEPWNVPFLGETVSDGYIWTLRPELVQSLVE